MEISKKIRNLYKSKGYTMAELAKKIGMTQAGLSKSLISEDFKISLLEKIANALEVPVNYFFEDSQKCIAAHLKFLNEVPEQFFEMENNVKMIKIEITKIYKGSIFPSSQTYSFEIKNTDNQ